MNPFKAVEDFHRKYKQDINQPFTVENMKLRADLIVEEGIEVDQELGFAPGMDVTPETVNRQNLTKELSDLIYVAIGAAVTWGLPLEEVFNRTHESNMTKDGGFSENGKVLKGPSYKPPMLEDLFEDV